MPLKKQNIQWFPLTVFFGLSVLIIVSAVLFYNYNKSAIKQDRYNEISAITSLKKQQIEKWLSERWSDAFFFYYNPAFHRDAARLGNNPGSASARQVVEAWLYPLYKNHPYRSISLWDERDNLLCMVGDSASQSLLAERITSIAKPDTIYFSDLYLSGETIAMDLIATVKAYGETRRLKLYFHVDPHKELFPLIQTWPTPSKTAETLLLASEGDSVLYLNELRHRKNTALRFKLPGTKQYTAAYMVSRQATGIAEGTDYRQIDALLNVVKLSHKNWYLVSKVDLDEIYSAIDQSVFLIFGFTILFISIAGVSVYTFISRTTIKQYRELLIKEQERAQAVQRYETLTRFANDAILIADEKANILEANIKTEELFGYTHEELLTKNLRELRTAQYASQVQDHQRRAGLEGGVRTLVDYIRKDGTVWTGDVSSKTIESGGKKYFFGIIRDITQTLADRRRIEKLNRFNILLNEINELIIRIENEDELLKKTCAMAVKHGGFVLVWIGIKTKLGTITPLASAGEAEQFLAGLTLQTADNSAGQSPAIRALATGQMVYINNLPEDPSVMQWRERIESAGIGAAAGLPLDLHREEPAFISFSVREKDFFYDEELQLLERIALNISFAVEKIHSTRMREKAEKESQIRKKNYESVAANIPGTDVYLFDLEFVIQLADGAEMKKLGLGSEIYTGKRIDRLLSFNGNGLSFGFFRRVLQGEELREEIRIQQYIYSVSGIPLKNEDGSLRGGIALITDITESKRKEEAVRASEEKHRNLINQMPDAVMQINGEGIITYASPAALELFVMTEENYWTISLASLITGSNEQEQEVIRGKVLSGTPVKGEERFKKLNGEEFYAEFSAQLTSSGEIQIVMRDITERRKNEQLIWQRTRQLQALFNTSRFYMGIIELRGNDAFVVMLNDAFTRFVGYEPGALNGECVRVYSESEEEYQSWIALFEQCRKNKQTLSFTAPFKIAGPDFYLQTSISQIEYPGEYDTFSFISFDISDRLRYERELLEKQDELHKLAVHLQSARENERIGIAREMHDELGQLLTAIKMNIAYLTREFKKGKFGQGQDDVVTELEGISSTVDRSVKGVRRLITQLRPEILDNLGLYAALEWLADDFRQKTGKPAVFINSTESPELSKDVSLALFRIVQESLTNVIKHAEANSVSITFARQGKSYELKIIDDGKGFSPDGRKAGKKFGLMGIKERMYIFGGEVTVHSEKGQGTAVLVRFPEEAVSDSKAAGSN
ncbi:MAG: hypothetical protein FMNOHCHN_01824 [Ignavibacteriaceae bacterium]|nr:hypothetical protein [Ignavibacteriaceae bacterium]